MRTIETTVYNFSELSDEAKEKAISEIKSWPDLFGWSDEWKDSIMAFCNRFNVKLKDWSIGPWCNVDYTHDATNKNFRGLKIKDVNRFETPTGFCGDCDLWQTFYDEFKHTGDALAAFDSAIYAGFKSWRNDWEHAYDDEAIIEFIEGNEYEFTEDGKRI